MSLSGSRRRMTASRRMQPFLLVEYISRPLRMKDLNRIVNQRRVDAYAALKRRLAVVAQNTLPRLLLHQCTCVRLSVPSGGVCGRYPVLRAFSRMGCRPVISKTRWKPLIYSLPDRSFLPLKAVLCVRYSPCGTPSQDAPARSNGYDYLCVPRIGTVPDVAELDCPLSSADCPSFSKCANI
jgi:hypothetical protein